MGAGGRPVLYLALAGALLAALVLSVGVGSVSLPPAAVGNALLHRAAGTAVDAIVWDLRLPRSVAGLLVGAGLAVAGVAFQAVFRNAMADPFVIGASSGASLGAAVAIVATAGDAFLTGQTYVALPRTVTLALGTWSIPAAAFAGSLAAVIAAFALARGIGTRGTADLVLAGLALGAFLSALVSFIITVADDQVQRAIVFWLAGGLGGRTWQHAAAAAPYVLIGLAVVWYHARELNLLALGEEEAAHLGVDVRLVQRVVLAAASLSTAAAVAVSGVIGFVGLIVPHLIRLAVGPDHRRLIPAAALGGAAFLLLADTLGRVLMPPVEIRVGIITGLVGSPFFLYLLRRAGRAAQGAPRA